MSTPIATTRPEPVLARPVLPVARPPEPPTVFPTAEPVPVVRPTRPADPVVRLGLFVDTAAEWVFGAAALWVGLAVLSAVPVAQFLVLGYLLEVAGRVARTGRLRDGFVGVREAARVGGTVLGVGLVWLPIWLVGSFAASAQVIDPGGPIARRWDVALSVLILVSTVHLTAALLRGGRLRDFLWPLGVVWLVRRGVGGDLFREAWDGLKAAVTRLRLPYYFWLGVRGYLGGLLWLAGPLALLGLGHRFPAVGLLGAGLLAVVILYVPFLQVRFARDNRLRTFRQLGRVRAAFCRAPVEHALALVVALASAMPLYLLKIEAIPRDLVYLEGLVFLAFIFPARLAAGWAVGRAGRRDRPRHWVVRWAARLAVVPFAVVYVAVVFTSQHVGWRGIPSLYEQHAFLLPVPFVELR